MEQDNELDHVRICLLPEWLTPFAKEAVHQTCDAEGQRRRHRDRSTEGCNNKSRQIDLDVVLLSASRSEDLFDAVAEIPFDLKNKSAHAVEALAEGEDLFGKRVHAASGLAAPDRTDDRDPV